MSDDYLDFLKQETRHAFHLAFKMREAAQEIDRLRSRIECNFGDNGLTMTYEQRRELLVRLHDLVREWE